MREKKNQETARRLREALSSAGLSQQELAEKSGVSKVSISQYINGTHVPGNKKAGQIASVLGCNPLWLMGFDVPMTENEELDLDELEQKIIKIYRTLPDNKKLALYEFVKTIAE